MPTVDALPTIIQQSATILLHYVEENPFLKITINHNGIKVEEEAFAKPLVICCVCGQYILDDDDDEYYQVHRKCAITNQMNQCPEILGISPEILEFTNQHPEHQEITNQCPEIPVISPGFLEFSNQHPEHQEITNQCLEIPEINPGFPEFANQHPKHQEITNQRPEHQEITNQRPEHREITNHRLEHQEITNQRLEHQEITNHRLEHQEITNHRLEHREITNQQKHPLNNIEPRSTRVKDIDDELRKAATKFLKNRTKPVTQVAGSSLEQLSSLVDMYDNIAPKRNYSSKRLHLLAKMGEIIVKILLEQPELEEEIANYLVKDPERTKTRHNRLRIAKLLFELFPTQHELLLYTENITYSKLQEMNNDEIKQLHAVVDVWSDLFVSKMALQ
ncbi:9150_t:CDS:1 [Ambispora gerdemannii]|uniref:9150_t:CDS:1 n=1 Tax=Ambispora gerdemannii TaxID=144530 RepID=A0A9N8V5I1_9GLOM|nr:9150_t:CDS:1 [Ambispora gerdemannii]